MVLERREFLTPRMMRIKNAAFFLVIAGVCGAYSALADDPEWWGWPSTVFFVLLGAAEILAIVKPPRFVVDEEGFQLEGWRLRPREKIRWHDVEGFLVATMRVRGRTTKFVAYKWREGSRDIGKFMKSANRLFGADAYIPMAWPHSHEAIVEELNDYRHRALQVTRSGGLSA